MTPSGIEPATFDLQRSASTNQPLYHIIILLRDDDLKRRNTYEETTGNK
jgi:hypothetical protein